MARKKLLIYIVFLMFFIFFADKLADKFFWYNSVWYFDMMMHFLGGFWVGLFFLYVFSLNKSNLDKFFLVILAVMFVGISWEIFEFIVNNVIGWTPFNSIDTLSDLFFDFFGGSVSIFYLFKQTMNDKQSTV